MTNIYFLLFYEFFKIGFFAIGGGYSTLPFLYHIGEQYGWYTAKELGQMIAVSCITPGPVGINVATYTGFKTAGFLGSCMATGAIILPAFILVVIISKLLRKFSDNFYVQSALYALKPASCAMIAAVGVKLFKEAIFKNGVADFSNIDFMALMILLALLLTSFKTKKDPLFYLGASAFIGLLLHWLVPTFI